MACDLRLNAEGKLDFRNNKKRIEKKKAEERKRTQEILRLHITCRLMHSSVPIYLFAFLCFRLFFILRKLMFGYPYPIV